MAAYNGKLYAGFGSSQGQGVILAYDGSSWTNSYINNVYGTIHAFAVYDGRLYAGTRGPTNGFGDILVYNGSTWSVSYDNGFNTVNALVVHEGRLYAGKGDRAYEGYGDVIVLSTTTTTSSSTTSSMTPSTSTTTTSSATSTTQWICLMPGNVPPCEVVAIAEVLSAINEWANGRMKLGDVVILINSWADPAAYPPL